MLSDALMRVLGIDLNDVRNPSKHRQCMVDYATNLHHQISTPAICIECCDALSLLENSNPFRWWGIKARCLFKTEGKMASRLWLQKFIAGCPKEALDETNDLTLRKAHPEYYMELCSVLVDITQEDRAKSQLNGKKAYVAALLNLGTILTRCARNFVET